MVTAVDAAICVQLALMVSTVMGPVNVKMEPPAHTLMGFVTARQAGWGYIVKCHAVKVSTERCVHNNVDVKMAVDVIILMAHATVQLVG